MAKSGRNKEAVVVGSKIKELRLKQGLTQEQLSEKLGIDNKRLSRIETGVSLPSLKIAKDLTKLFDLNFYDLIDNPSSAEIEIPDNYYVQSLHILKTAKSKQEKACYLEALKHTQKCLSLNKCE